MALETLKGVKMIDGFEVAEIVIFSDHLSTEFIIVNHMDNSIFFKIQKGGINEVGINGCQVDTLIETARLIILEWNKNIPCKENDEVLTYLHKAIECLKARKLDREKRGIEGYVKS